MGEVWVQLLGVEWVSARVILVLCECMWNAPAVSLVLPPFDDTVSLGYHRRWVVYSRGFHPGWLLPVSFRGIGKLS